MSPEARQRLDHGFQRRAEEQQTRHAADWQHAAQLGETLGLGRPLGIFHLETTPPLGVRRVLRLLVPAAMFLLVLVLLIVWTPDTALPLLSLIPFVAVGYCLVFFVVSRRGRFTRWLYGYAGGLAEADPDGPPRVVRFAEVTDVVDEWSSSGSESSWDYQGFRLTTADGRTVPITAKYRNALDPYGPVGALIAALAPAEVGTAVPRFPSTADLITDGAVIPIAARAAATVRSGETVVRGDLRVAPDGIAGPKDTAITPWAAIERIELRPGHVKVRRIGGKALKYDNYRDGSGYAVLCHVLIALGVDASFEPRG
ncbi:hypothetical protein Aph02nite_22760 [Actinoplanes philippinensis]|nr:hypothetical protein [Actinoplanes philippinensis]GIE76326.1 hypothetical protein Aph02nite_22760 [Actinoplanes philippinensis]